MKRKTKEQKQARKINQWWNTLKQLWGDTRYRAMIKLGMYFIFVGGILLFLQISNIMSQNQKEVVYQTPMEKLSEKKEYQYQIKLEELNSTWITQEVLGKRDSLIDKFTVTGSPISYLIQDQQYYITNETGTVMTTNPVMFDIHRITPSTLNDMVLAGEELATTNYKNGIDETSYEISLKAFIKIYSGVETDVTGNIICKVQLENQVVTKVSLDWTSYRKLQDPTVVSSNLTIVLK